MTSVTMPIHPYEFIQRAYIAFFNRPTDVDGLYHWLNYVGSNQDLLDQFAQSEEYLSDYAGKSDVEIIQTIYQNLFGRAPEPEGLNYWEAQMNAGWVTISNAALAILAGAQGTDWTTIQNKVEVAQAFTDALDTPDEINAYARAGDNNVGHLAKDWLATVSYTIESYNAALINLNSVLTTLVDANNTLLPLPGDGTPTEDNDPSARDLFSDQLDFSGVGLSSEYWAGVTTLYDNGYAGSSLGYPVVESALWEWQSMRYPELGTGDKYLTFTRPNDSTTEYKIELWTVLGEYADAYAATYTNTAPLDAGEILDAVELIGYADLGRVMTADDIQAFFEAYHHYVIISNIVV